MNNEEADKLEQLNRLLFWLPPIVGLIGMGIESLIKWTDKFSGTTALLFWFGTVIVLLYKSGVYAKDGITHIEDQEYRERIMNLHLETLHPGNWIVIVFVHVIIFALAVLGASWLW